MFIFNNFSTCFGHHYAHLQENKTYVTACVVLRWFCWMWLVAAVGRCLVGCEQQCSHPTSNCCILLVFSLTPQFGHDARSQKPEAKAVFFYVNFKSVYVVQVFHRLDSTEYFKYINLKNISKFFVSFFIYF